MKLRIDRKEDRQKEAKQRHTDYSKLSADQKLARLDQKLGTGVGAVKQRESLLNPPAPPKLRKDKETKTPKKTKHPKRKNTSKYKQKKEKQETD